MRFKVIAAIAVTFALGACRREVPYAPVYEPMKLGAAVDAPEHSETSTGDAAAAQ